MPSMAESSFSINRLHVDTPRPPPVLPPSMFSVPQNPYNPYNPPESVPENSGGFWGRCWWVSGYPRTRGNASGNPYNPYSRYPQKQEGPPWGPLLLLVVVSDQALRGP